MDLYHIWFDAKPGVRDMTIAQAAERFLSHLKADGLIEGHRLTRRKLGLGPSHLGEWHIMIETRDLAQLDKVFNQAASRAGAMEEHHHGLNSLAHNLTFALYRDFPDPGRVTGEERF